MVGLETERKYIIKKPDVEALSGFPDFSVSRITQTYLLSEGGITHRVRARERDGVTVYTECKKLRLTPVTCREDEREIDVTEYEALLARRDPDAKTIKKTRVTLRYENRLLEVDIYPAWEHSCIMEVELPSEDTAVSFPPVITILKEVTGDKRYSNAGMARSFPKEII